MTEYGTIKTTWGTFGFVVRGERLLATFLPQAESNVERRIRSRWSEAVKRTHLLPRFQRRIKDYFAGRPVSFRVETDLAELPPFRQTVLEACRRIPFGKTAGYGDLARVVGNPKAARAVGGAMANNPTPLVIPCHRVLRSDGALGGFSSPRGIQEKRRLLRLEGVSL